MERMVLTRLIERSRKLGAKAAEVLIEQRDELTVGWERGSAGVPVQSCGSSLRMGVYLDDGRQAWFEVEAPNTEQLIERVEAPLRAALAKAQLDQPDPWSGPADRYDIAELGLGLLDRRQAQLSLEDRREVLEDNAHGCRSVHPDIRIEKLSYREALIERGHASSRGHAATERSSVYEAILEARMGRSGRRHVQRVASRQFANIASMPFGAELAQSMVRLTTPAELPGGTLPLIVDAAALAHLLRCLAPAFDITAVRGGSSFLRDSVGLRVAAPKLHVIDDPSLPGALCSRAFDDRGVPPAPVVILREGVAAGFYLDPRSARIEDLRPTGHHMAGGLQPSNLVVRPGNRSRNAIGMEIEDYLVLDSFHAARPVDLATGMLDTRCDLLVFRGHSYVGAVQGVPLSMPVTELLGAVVEVAGDQARYAEVDACSLVLEGVSLTG